MPRHTKQHGTSWTRLFTRITNGTEAKTTHREPCPWQCALTPFLIPLCCTYTLLPLPKAPRQPRLEAFGPSHGLEGGVRRFQRFHNPPHGFLIAHRPRAVVLPVEWVFYAAPVRSALAVGPPCVPQPALPRAHSHTAQHPCQGKIGPIPSRHQAPEHCEK